VPLLADRFRVSLTLTFLFGSCIAVYAKRIPWLDGLGILSGIVVLVTLRYGAFDVVGIAAGAYFVLYLGARLPQAFQWIGAKNDYSYGIYIYGFLVQQILAFAGVHHLGYLVYALSALVLTTGLAWLSWHVVEKRAMALKDWGPGRGWRHWWERIGSWRKKEATA
jgi:peptidoglycan/LPS O-acetylase OafA/YrhL